MGPIGVEVALQYTDATAPSEYYFANTINTPDGGTHQSGLRSALTRTLNDYARKANILKEKDANLDSKDTLEGLTAIVSIKHPEPQFESQTKVKLMNTDARTAVEQVTREALAASFWRRTRARPSDHREVPGLAARPRGGQGGQRTGAPQERAGERHAARQAGRLL